MLPAGSAYCALIASAQSSPPATPAPYNQIALAEVTGSARTAVQAGQANFKTQTRNPYFGGIPSTKLNAATVDLTLTLDEFEQLKAGMLPPVAHRFLGWCNDQMQQMSSEDLREPISCVEISNTEASLNPSISFISAIVSPAVRGEL